MSPNDWFFVTNKEGNRTPIYDKDVKNQAQATAKYGKDAVDVGETHRYTSVNGRVELQPGGKSEKLTTVDVLVVDGKAVDKGDVGHTAVQVGNKVYGYYPVDVDNDGAWGMDDLTGSPGQMQVESRADFDAKYSSDGVTDITLEVTASQAAGISSNLNGKVSNPGTYSLQGNQCTSVAADALTGAGVALKQPSMKYGPLPMNSWGLSPSRFKSYLISDINKGVVVGQKSYGGR